jgi:broad specificity phosphatase PhoE
MPHPTIYLARHGETEWSITGQHTGMTDLPLTPRGEVNARALAPRLAGIDFAKVFTSPLQRASRTSVLAGFRNVAETMPELVEWNYGDYEGVTTHDIQRTRPGWQIFRDGCPNGEMPADIGARADRVIARLRAINGDVLCFSSGHFLRVLAARWLDFDAAYGSRFLLSTASVSALSYDHDLTEPAIKLWNDTQHVV